MATEEKDEREEKDEAAADDAKDEAESKADEAEEQAEAKPAKASASKSAAAKAKSARGAGGARTRAPAAKQGSSLGKSMILFVVIIGGLAAGFAILGREEQHGPPKPKWGVGQTVDVEITLVKNDKNDLSCASPDEVAGKHCAFEAVNKPWSKGPSTDDKTVLKPYTTTDRVQFTAAGVWSEPALSGDKLPTSRFSLKCKYKVEGTLKNLSVRWDPTGPWHPNADWYAGSVSDCKLGQ